MLWIIDPELTFGVWSYLELEEIVLLLPGQRRLSLSLASAVSGDAAFPARFYVEGYLGLKENIPDPHCQLELCYAGRVSYLDTRCAEPVFAEGSYLGTKRMVLVSHGQLEFCLI